MPHPTSRPCPARVPARLASSERHLDVGIHRPKRHGSYTPTTFIALTGLDIAGVGVRG